MKNAVLVYIQILATIFTLLVFNSCMPGTPAQQDAPQNALAPPCEVLPAPPATKSASLTKALTASQREDGHQIDVMVLLSPQLLKTLTTAQAAALPGAIITDTNAILTASRCRPRMRLVYSGAWWRSEVGVSATDLANLTADSTTSLLRAKYGADLVLLDVLNTGGPAGTSYVNYWTGVVKHAYDVSFHSAAHELMHECGAVHDKAHAPFAPIPPTPAYAYGAHSTNYGDVLDETGKTRVAVLSNGGRFTYKAPSGTAITLGDSTSDIAKAIDATSATVANRMPPTVK